VKNLKFLPLFFFLIGSLNAREDRPNVLWIYLEDVSGWFSCYGETLIETPHIDQLAKEGIRFDRFYTPPVSVLPPALRLLLG
jgi:N-sulfoglucosamine sulfohydrolase